MKQKSTYVSPVNEEIEWNSVILCTSTGASVEKLIEDEEFNW